MNTPSSDDAPALARTPAILVMLGAGALFVVAAAVLVPWSWIPGGELVSATPSDVFTVEEIQRAEEYSTLRRYLSLASYFLSLLVALILGLTPIGARLVRKLTGGRAWWMAVPLGVAAVLLVGRAATLPLSAFIHQLNRDYGLSNQAWGGWGVDVAKSYGVGVVLTSLVLLVLVACARRSPRWWFAWAGGLSALLVVAASFLYPVVVEPIFNKFTPMSAGPFRASVFELAESEGVQVDDVLVADASRRTTTLNAYVSGFGGTRRVVVYDNLLKELTPDEARVVIAHELAHAKHQDVLVGTLLGGLGGVAGLALLALLLDSRRLRRRARVSSPADPAAVALVLALSATGTFLSSPVLNTISRAVEVRADRDSIAATGQGDVFAVMQHELAVHSLSDPTPPRLNHVWFGSHPTVLQRVGIPASLEGRSR